MTNAPISVKNLAVTWLQQPHLNDTENSPPHKINVGYFSSMKKNRLIVALTGLTFALPLAGCNSTTPSGGDIQSSSGSQSAGGQSASTSASSSATSEDTLAQSDGAVVCSASQLKLTVSQPNGAAGSEYRTISAVNQGDTACVLSGYPGVSFLDDSGQQVGAPADRTGEAASSVSLRPGEEGQATLRIINPDNIEGCTPVEAKNLRIYPPESTAAVSIPGEFQTCAETVSNTQISPFTAQP